MDRVDREESESTDVVTRERLDLLVKESGTQEFLPILGSSCHPGAPTIAAYDKENGRLLLGCAVCQDMAFTIQVARVTELN